MVREASQMACLLFFKHLLSITKNPFKITLNSGYLCGTMSTFRNFKMVDYVVYGRGSFNQLDDILKPQRKDDSPIIFLVDHFFEGKELPNRVPVRGNDKIIFVDVT